MRVAVIDTKKVTSDIYYDVAQILFNTDDVVTLIFYSGETKNYFPANYTDIDCKRQM